MRARTESEDTFMGRPPYSGWFHYFIGSKTRALVIQRLVRDPDCEPCFRELARGTGAGMGALHRELRELERIGLITSTRRGGARYYQLRPEHPLASPLCELVRACEQVDALEPLGVPSVKIVRRPGTDSATHSFP